VYLELAIIVENNLLSQKKEEYRECPESIFFYVNIYHVKSFVSMLKIFRLVSKTKIF